MPLNNPISNSDSIAVLDSANNYTSNNIEGVLAEIGTKITPIINTTGAIALADNTIYRRGELSALTLPLITPATNHYSIVEFTSGATPTAITDSTGAKWVGDSIVFTGGVYVFTPLANKRYNISFMWDGAYLIACSLGVGI